MSHNAVERARDGERLAVALLLAMIMHGGIALLVPAEFLRPLPDFEPPLYVEFEPLPPTEQVEPVEEPPVTEAAPPEQPEPVPPPEPAETPEIATGDGSPTPRDAPAPAATTTPAATPPAPTFVPEEAPPAPQRSVDRSALQQTAPQSSPAFIEAELSRYYDFQEEWIAARNEWEERTAAASSPTDRIAEEPDAAPLEDQLRRVLEGIRRSADGDPRVVDLGDDRPRAPGSDDSIGDGSGIRIGDDRDGRYRISAGTLDLSDLRLPAGFPVEYPIACRVRVTADGVVTSARVEPPTPSQELNDRVNAWVRTWRFQPSRDAGVTETRFTIILRTR